MPITKTDVYDVQAPFALDLRLVKADLNARNAIGTFQRYLGMVVAVLNDYTFWQLQGGTSNDDWVQVFLPAGAGIQSVVVNSAAPSGGNNGDIWFQQVGGTVAVSQKVNDEWAALGVIVVSGDSASYTTNNSLDPFSTTSAALDSAYPDSKTGDMVANEDADTLWTKLESGKWTKTSLDIA